MASRTIVFVGTYTEPIRFGTGQILEGKGKGIYSFELNMQNGELKLIGENTGIVNPSYLTLDVTKKHLYAVNELKLFEGQASGAVSAFALDPSTFALTLLNQRATGGTDPCHVIVNEKNTHVFISNFMSGSVCVFPIGKDGSLESASQFIQHEGHSVNPKRQAGPHAHSLIFDKSNRYAFVPDLGIDRLMIYKTDFAKGTLTPGATPWYQTTPGAGPRHCEFTPDGRFSFLINELESSFSVLAYDEEAGSFKLVQTVPTVVDKGFTGETTCADLHLLPNGKFLYGSNRGHNSIVCYAVDTDSGRLTYVDITPCGGQIPRNFAIDPSGTYMLVANQDTDNIVVFRIDGSTGKLTKVSDTYAPTPVCVKPYVF
jgi:6-phosphogluconolactonase